MDIKPIHNDHDYEVTLAEIERIFDAQPGTEEADRLDILLTLVEVYEAKHYSIPLPDPIEAINYHMERLGLTRKDLEQFIGSRARVSEILNRKRPLTLRMIRNLQTGLGISSAVLLQKYPTEMNDEQVQGDVHFTQTSGNTVPINTDSSAGFRRFPRSRTINPSKINSFYKLYGSTGSHNMNLPGHEISMSNPSSTYLSFEEVIQ